MGVATGCGCKEVYIDFIILLIPTPLKKNVFRSLLYNCKQSESIECSMAQILAIYIFQAVCRAVNILNVSMCI